MTRDDIQKLLGGYATGTLTPEEQQALFAAALEDQDLFDAMAKEQALRDLLRDPAARAEVLAALDEHPEPWWRRAARWMLRPAAVGAMAACVAAVVGYGIWHARQTPPPVLVADNRPPQVAPSPRAVVAEPEQAEKQAPRNSAVREAVPLPRLAKPVASPPPPPATAASSGPVVALDGKGAPGDTRDLVVSGSVSQGTLGQGQSNQVQLKEQDQVQQQNPAPLQQQVVAVTAAAPTVKTEPAPAAPPEPLRLSYRSSLESAGTAFAVPAPELKWSTLRREEDGSLSPVEADQIRTGNRIVLRLEPYADGYLSVVEPLPGGAVPRMVLSTRVERAKAVDIPALTLDHPGVQQFLVQFTSQVATPGLGAAVRAAKRKDAPAKDTATYVPSSQQTITLRYR